MVTRFIEPIPGFWSGASISIYNNLIFLWRNRDRLKKNFMWKCRPNRKSRLQRFKRKIVGIGHFPLKNSKQKNRPRKSKNFSDETFGGGISFSHLSGDLIYRRCISITVIFIIIDYIQSSISPFTTHPCDDILQLTRALYIRPFHIYTT